MRTPLVPAALIVPALLVAACSSAPPTETAQPTSEALIPACAAGTHADCSGDGPHGQMICTCVPDSGCTFSVAPMPTWMSAADGTGGITYGLWVAAWAVPTSTGACPVITLPTGRWAEIGQAIGQYDVDSTDGVPMSVGSWLSQSDCSQVPGMTAGHCCTYVWWPNGYPKQGANGYPDDVGLPAQDTTNLCLVQGGKNVALEMFSQDCAVPDGGSCPVPGNGGCSTCVSAPGH